MPKKCYRTEEIIAKLREAEVLLGQGLKVLELSRPSALMRSPTAAGAASTG